MIEHARGEVAVVGGEAVEAGLTVDGDVDDVVGGLQEAERVVAAAAAKRHGYG